MAHRLTITIPDETYEQIKDRAERDYRSISQEIIYLLEKFTPLSQPTPPVQPVQPTLSYPPGVRNPIPEKPLAGPNPYTSPYTEYYNDPNTQSTARRKIIE